MHTESCPCKPHCSVAMRQGTCVWAKAERGVWGCEVAFRWKSTTGDQRSWMDYIEFYWTRLANGIFLLCQTFVTSITSVFRMSLGERTWVVCGSAQLSRWKQSSLFLFGPGGFKAKTSLSCQPSNNRSGGERGFRHERYQPSKGASRNEA